MNLRHNKECVFLYLYMDFNEGCVQYWHQGLNFKTFKGTVSRDFLLLVFFMNQFPPTPRVSH